MKFADNEVPDDVRGMYDEIIRMRDYDDTIKAAFSEHNMEKDPLSALVLLAYSALRQKEMWKDAMEDVSTDLKRATAPLKLEDI